MANTETHEVDIYKINKIIRKYSLIASASGFIPIPVADLAALSAVQLRMIHEIGREYGYTFSEHAGKSIGISALNSLVAPTMASVGASALKIVPGVGGMLGKYAFHAYAAASTYAMGKLFNNPLRFRTKRIYVQILKKYKINLKTLWLNTKGKVVLRKQQQLSNH